MEGIIKRCKISGNGLPIVLCHGMGGPIVWDQILSHLDGKFEVIIPTFPGYIESDGIIDYSDELYVEFIESVRSSFGLSKIILVGLSMGGRSVLNYAIKYHENLLGLVLVDSIGIGNMSPLFSNTITRMLLEELLYRFLKKSDRIQFLDNGDFIDKNSEEYAQAFTYMRNLMSSDILRRNFVSILVKVGTRKKEWNSKIGKIIAPTLILWGEIDKTASLNWGKMLHQLIPNSKMHILGNYGHMAIMERPEYFSEVIKKEFI